MSLMPVDLSKKKVLVVDGGFFICAAQRLARDFGTVYYCDPAWETAQTKYDHALTGVGLDGIERVKEVWDVIDDVDLVVFPDVLRSGMQLHIEKMGIPVWGARRADKLEINKLFFKQLQERLGMNFAEYDVVDSLDALRDYCKDPKNDGRWIKATPQFRGDKETFENVSYEESKEHLADMELRLGAIGSLLRFLAEKPIKAKLEGGLDTYSVDGMHPKVAVQGYEKKDMGYFATVQNWEDIPDEIKSVCEPLWPELKKRRCRQMVSTEVKITDAGDSILLEPTVRFPSPAGEEQMELYGNFSAIIWEGAHGNLIEPEITAQFACEAMIEHNGKDTNYRSLKVPKEIERWVKLYQATGVKDRIAIAPGQSCIGAVVGIGNTPKEALEHLKDNADALKDQPVKIHVSELAHLLEEIEEAQAQGVHFTDKPMPEPAEVLA